MTDEEVMAIVRADQVAHRARLGIGGRLVHYTSAESAYRIITGAEVWLRSAAVMNDFSEINHGLSCLHDAWESTSGQALQQLLDRLRPGLRNELAELFNGHAPYLRDDTYLVSLSEHHDTEDQLGRLSMWRAYGGKAGVALVLNPRAFLAATDVMKVFSEPVIYADQQSFVTWFQGWAAQLLAIEDALRTGNPDTTRNALFYAFRVFAMCTKHPGFAEEREWRVFHSPTHEG